VPPTTIENQVSSIEHRESSIEYRASSIEYRESSIQRTKKVNFAKQTQFPPFLRQKLTFTRKTNPIQTQSNPIFCFFHLAHPAYPPQTNPISNHPTQQLQSFSFRSSPRICNFCQILLKFCNFFFVLYHLPAISVSTTILLQVQWFCSRFPQRNSLSLNYFRR
jgi:hypothetical protein